MGTASEEKLEEVRAAIATGPASAGVAGAAAPTTGDTVGGRASTATPAAVDVGDLVRAWFDLVGRQHTFSDPGTGAAAIVKSDATVLVGIRAIFVGAVGTVVVDTADGDTDVSFTIANVPFVLPVCAVKVKAASTATLMVGLK